MCQIFDGITLFDAAKSAIQLFVYKREMVSQRLKTKSDKFFLMTLDEDVTQSIICNWTTSTEHFLYQLKSLKLTYDYTNIDSAIQKAFTMLNCIKKIGYEKHIQGRLFSKIQNSFIILLTDGSPFCTPKKVMNVSMISMIDINQECSFYKEVYRWDQSMYTIVLGTKESCASYKELEKYSQYVCSQITFVSNMEALILNIDELTERQLNYKRVYVLFKLNSTLLPQQNIQIDQAQNKTKFKLNSQLLLTSIDNLVTSNDTIKDKWPFPDELLVNKDHKKIPTKKAIPTYMISNTYKTNFSMFSEYYDEYDITDKNFLLKLLSNYPDLYVNQIEKNIYWEIYIEILNSMNKIELKPFAVILLKIQSIEDDKVCLFDYFANKFPSKKTFQLKFLLLPYNYEELFSVLSRCEDTDISKPQAGILLGKYFAKIPFYYKPYVLAFIKKKSGLNLTDSIDNGEKENISTELNQEIELIYKTEKDQLKEINRNYNKNKQLHLGKNSSCCKREYVFKPKTIKDQQQSLNGIKVNLSKAHTSSDDYKSFINKCFNISKALKQQKEDNKYQIPQVNQIIQPSIYSNLPLIKKDFNDMEIDLMGDYRDYLYKNKPLRDHHYFDEEIKLFIGDIFGNPFKPIKEYYVAMPSLQLANNSQGIFKEDLLINSISEKELSVYPSSSLSKKTLRDHSISSIDRKFPTVISPMHSRSNSLASSGLSSPFNVRDDDLIKEFSETTLMTLNIKDNTQFTTHGINYKIDLNDLYAWKINTQLKMSINKRFGNCIRGTDNIVELFDYLIQQHNVFYSKNQMVTFLIRLLKFCEDVEMDKLILNRINRKIKTL